MLVLGELERLDTARGISPERKAKISKLVEKYAKMLSVNVIPEITIRNNLNSNWLGRTTWTARNPDNTVVELQKSILEDDRTLERIIAHEMVHHVQMLEFTDEDIARLRLGLKRDGHGPRFHELAKYINEQVGDPNFVTETSDESYDVRATKSFYLLVVPFGEEDGPMAGKYGYAATARLTPKAHKFINKYVPYGARLFRSSDLRWIQGGAKIGGQFGVPRAQEDQDKLKAIYASAEPR